MSHSALSRQVSLSNGVEFVVCENLLQRAYYGKFPWRASGTSKLGRRIMLRQ